jgi:hypothetical protein
MGAFNLKKFAFEEQERKLRVQKKIMEFLLKERMIDTNVFVSPNAKEVILSIGDDRKSRYSEWTTKLRKLLGTKIKVEQCKKCKKPTNWVAALGPGGFGRRSVLLTEMAYACVGCGRDCDEVEAKLGCSVCHNTLFKVARRELPLIQNPQKDPYRPHDSQEDGYKMTTPLGEGDISGSGLGSNSRRDMAGYDEVGQLHGDETQMVNNQLPQDQDAFDISANPEPDGGSYGTPSSPALTDDDSPFDPSRHKEPRHIGIHNMPQPYNSWRDQDVFEKIRNRVKGQK